MLTLPDPPLLVAGGIIDPAKDYSAICKAVSERSVHACARGSSGAGCFLPPCSAVLAAAHGHQHHPPPRSPPTPPLTPLTPLPPPIHPCIQYAQYGYTCTCTSTIDHAVTVVGYDTTDPANSYWIVK